MIRKGNTRKSVDQILDEAADILEAHGWVTGMCYDSETGGYCALGAIAQAVYPQTKGDELSTLAYPIEYSEAYRRYNKRDADPRHVEAIETVASVVKKSFLNQLEDHAVYDYNDRTSAKLVVAKLRKAAEKYRAKQAA